MPCASWRARDALAGVVHALPPCASGCRPTGGRGVRPSVQCPSPAHLSDATDGAGCLSRQDHTAVCTLAGWVAPPGRPSPLDSRAAFAFSVLCSPLFPPPSWRSGDHGRGEPRADPVGKEEECGPVRLKPLPRGACRCRPPQEREVILPTSLVGMASQPLWPWRLHEVVRGLCTGVHPARPSLVPRRIEAGRGRNIVLSAAHRGGLVRTSGEGHPDITGLAVVPGLLLRYCFMNLMRCNVCTFVHLLVASG
jgi:hypothetical protein